MLRFGNEKKGVSCKGCSLGRTGLLLILLLVWGALFNAVGKEPVNQPPFEFTSVEFEVLLPQEEQDERPQIPENTVIEGDRVRLSAVVRNQSGEPSQEFAVRLFFEGEISRETGKIGQEMIHRLDDGEELRTSVLWDTADLRPGTYTIIANANHTGGQEIEGYGSITVLKEGLYIDFLGPLDFPHREPLCPMGRILTELHFIKQDFVNMGTIPIEQGDLEVRVSYRGSQGSTFVETRSSPLEATLWRVADGQEIFLTDKLLTGEKGKIRFQTRYDFDLTEESLRFPKPDSLRFGNQIRMKLEALADSRSVSLPMYVPSKKSFLTVYSKLDLWTFPSRPDCGGVESAGKAVEVAPAIEGGKVFFVISSADSASEVYRLYSRTTTTGTPRWETPVEFTSRVTSPAIGKRGKNTVVYLGSASSEDSVYAIVDIDLGAGADPPAEANRDTGFPKPGVAELIGPVHYKPAIKTDVDIQGNGRDTIYVPSDNGLFALNGDGSLKWRITEPGAVTQPVTVVADTGDVWFASNKFIYRVRDPGDENGDELEENMYSFFPVDAAITTALSTTGTGEETIVYFCTQESSIYTVTLSGDRIINAAKKSKIEAQYVHGLCVVGDPVKSTTIYAYTELGIHKLTFESDDVGFTQDEIYYDISKVEGWVPARTPAVLLDSSDSFRALFITTHDGELLALSEDLDEILKVEIWGNEEAEFRFRALSATMTKPVVAPDFDVVVVGTAEDGFIYAFEFSDD